MRLREISEKRAGRSRRADALLIAVPVIEMHRNFYLTDRRLRAQRKEVRATLRLGEPRFAGSRSAVGLLAGMGTGACVSALFRGAASPNPVSYTHLRAHET